MVRQMRGLIQLKRNPLWEGSGEGFVWGVFAGNCRGRERQRERRGGKEPPPSQQHVLVLDYSNPGPAPVVTALNWLAVISRLSAPCF